MEAKTDVVVADETTATQPRQREPASFSSYDVSRTPPIRDCYYPTTE